MLRRLAKRMGLAILAVVVVALPVVAGCGGSGTEARPVVIMGSLADLTGPNSSSNIPWIEGLKDYLRWLDVHDPLPVNLKWIFYDTKTDYGRV
ncbi:MAG: hypothetical protein NTU41_12290, partial [Chloroflexi bacterium]|nr:hypothetical protein [Chloroflexota bacterium]